MAMPRKPQKTLDLNDVAKRRSVAQACYLRELAEVTALLGGGVATARLLGCGSTLLREWNACRSSVSAEHAAILAERLRAISSRLPQLMAALRDIRRRAEARAIAVAAARRERLVALHREPAQHNVRGLTREERLERNRRRREAGRRLRAGESAEELGREYGVEPHTVEKWAWKTGGLV